MRLCQKNVTLPGFLYGRAYFDRPAVVRKYSVIDYMRVL